MPKPHKSPARLISTRRARAAEQTDVGLRVIHNTKVANRQYRDKVSISIWESPPQYQLMCYGHTLYRLPLPWIYYKVIYGFYKVGSGTATVPDCRISGLWGARHRITDFLDTALLFHLPLPNLDTGDRPCYPAHFFRMQDVPDPTEEKLSHLTMQAYWESDFNDDYVNRIWRHEELMRTWRCEGDFDFLLRTWQGLTLDQLSLQHWHPLDQSIMSISTGPWATWDDGLGEGNEDGEDDDDDY